MGYSLYNAEGKLVEVKRLGDLPQEELLQYIIARNSEPFKTIDIDLSVAQTQEIESQISGGVFQIVATSNNDPSVYVDVKFNRNQSSAIRMRLGDRIVTPFRSVVLKWPAQTGTMTLGVGIELENLFRFDKANNQSGLSISSIDGLTKIPSGATEVYAKAIVDAGGATPTALYTVTTAKTLYLKRMILSGAGNSGVSLVRLRHTNSGGTLIKELLFAAVTTNVKGDAFLELTVPYPMKAGEKLEMASLDYAGAANTLVYRAAAIWGWEI